MVHKSKRFEVQPPEHVLVFLQAKHFPLPGQGTFNNFMKGCVPKMYGRDHRKDSASVASFFQPKAWWRQIILLWFIIFVVEYDGRKGR